jgi:hypothetical protein
MAEGAGGFKAFKRRELLLGKIEGSKGGRSEAET